MKQISQLPRGVAGAISRRIKAVKSVKECGKLVAVTANLLLFLAFSGFAMSQETMKTYWLQGGKADLGAAHDGSALATLDAYLRRDHYHSVDQHQLISSRLSGSVRGPYNGFAAAGTRNDASDIYYINLQASPSTIHRILREDRRIVVRPWLISAIGEPNIHVVFFNKIDLLQLVAAANLGLPSPSTRHWLFDDRRLMLATTLWEQGGQEKLELRNAMLKSGVAKAINKGPAPTLSRTIVNHCFRALVNREIGRIVETSLATQAGMPNVKFARFSDEYFYNMSALEDNGSHVLADLASMETPAAKVAFEGGCLKIIKDAIHHSQGEN